VEGGFSQSRLALRVRLTVVLLFGFDRCEISDRGVQPVLVEPVHPGEGREFEFVDGVERAVDPVVLFGAHMRGLSLNHQIVALGGRFVETVATAPRSRMHAVPGSIERPGISEAPDGVTGPSIDGEVWLFSAAALGSSPDLDAPLRPAKTSRS
jgi:hypothetical protein